MGSSASARPVLRTLVVDDEPYVRADLVFLLREHSDIEVVAEASAVESARAQIQLARPDVVFLDVQLRGGSGFELMPHIPPDTAIIFVTAYDRYAVQAFEVNALDYLLKPVAPERLAEAVARLRARFRSGSAATTAEQRLARQDPIYVKTDDAHHMLELQKIVAISAYGGNYSVLFCDDGRELITRRTMKIWEQTLPDDMFCRVHRKHIVNMQRALSVERIGNKVLITLDGLAKAIPTSRRMRADAISWLEPKKRDL